MSTLPPAHIQKFGIDTLEKKVYTIAEELKEYMPLESDRNRLGFNLFKKFKGEGDDVTTIFRTNKFQIQSISRKDLIKLIEEKLSNI
ncbi:MAG: hypothetical protein FJ213_04330 [Ignavibacteria bacterium]|nr:hypothetical protein [Ignavibacteria bacterium]